MLKAPRSGHKPPSSCPPEVARVRRLVVVACMAPVVAAAAAAVIACGSFGADDSPVPADAPEASDGSSVEGGDSGAGAVRACAGDAHAFCDDFDEPSESTALSRWSALTFSERTSRVGEGFTSAPFALRVSVPAGSVDALTPLLQATLPAASKVITCTSDLRLVRAASTNAAQLAVLLEGPGGSGSTSVVTFLTEGARELGVYRALSDGGEDYTYDFKTQSMPHTTRPIMTTLRLELASPSRAVLSWAGGPTVTVPLDGKLPPTIAKVVFAIGAKLADPDGGVVDVRFDNVYCDVE